MQKQNRPKKSALRKATGYFLAGVVWIVAGIFINATSTSCTTLSNGTQLCTVVKPDGLDAHTFMLGMFVVAFICLAVAVVYLRKHQQSE